MVDNNEKNERSLQGNESTAYANHGTSTQNHDDGSTEGQNETKVSRGECHDEIKGGNGSSRDSGEGNEGGYASEKDEGKQNDNDGGAEEHFNEEHGDSDSGAEKHSDDEQGDNGGGAKEQFDDNKQNYNSGDAEKHSNDIKHCTGDSSPNQASRYNSEILKSNSLCNIDDISRDIESRRYSDEENIPTEPNSPEARLGDPIVIQDDSVDTPKATNHSSKRRLSSSDEEFRQQKRRRKGRPTVKYIIIRAETVRDEQSTEWRWNGRSKHWENGRQQRTASNFTKHDKLAITTTSNDDENYTIKFTCTGNLWTGKQHDNAVVQFFEYALGDLLTGKAVDAWTITPKASGV